MGSFDFTDEQKAVINAPESAFADACPGAGKTETIVERFIRRPSVRSQRGVALLSFTRAATDEAMRRAHEANKPYLVESPNFVGTFDSFLNRYVVGPLVRADVGQAPTFRDSWASAPGGVVVAKVNPRDAPTSFSLDWFDFTESGARLAVDRVGIQDWRMIERSGPELIAKAEIVAFRRWQKLIDNGFVDCARARQLFRAAADDPWRRGQITDVLGGRFAEVIVDEVQDCNDDDLAMLELLLEAGLALVAVGDLEQSIFGFRGSVTRSRLQTFTDRLGDPLPLTKNFRSSPAICSVNNSVRGTGKLDVAEGSNQHVAQPVYLGFFPGPTAAQAAVASLLVEAGAVTTDFIFLAHSGSAARTYAGGGARPSDSTNKVLLMARAALQLRETSSRARREALTSLHRIFRELSGDLQDLSDQAFFEATSLDEVSFREGCFSLLSEIDPLALSAKEYAAKLRLGLAALGWKQWVGGTLQAPPDSKWKQLRGNEASWRHSTIHSFKGLQAPCVGVVLSKPPSGSDEAHSIECWRDGLQSEARRVLYVGVSRAEQLLVLIVQKKSQLAAVSELLERDRVSFKMLN